MIETRFKNTEVGRIPEDWEIITIGEIGLPLMCKRVLKEQTALTGEVPFYKIGTFGKEADVFISRGLFEDLKSKFSYPRKGDILISAAGTIGRTVVFDGHDAYFQDSNIVWIDNNQKKVSNNFLAIWYRVIKWATTDGGTITRLYNKNLQDSLVVKPPLLEQSRIATALSDVDSLISTLEALIEKKRAIKQGTMQELLSGKRRLPGFTGEWVKYTLGNVAKINARIGWQGLKSSEFLATGPCFLVTGTDFFNAHINWNSCCFVEKYRYEQDKNIQLRQYDVLVSKDGTIGKVAYVSHLPGLATLNSGVFVVRSTHKKISQQFLAWIFLSSVFKDFIDFIVSGSTISHLYQRDIVKFTFRCPAEFAEQTAIASILTSMDSEISSLESKLEKYKTLKQGMMQQLLTGKIRLI